MRHYFRLLPLTTLLISSSVFADVMTTSNPSTALAFSEFDNISFKPCENIANACLNAGYERVDQVGKTFWHDCMKPILLGKSAAGAIVTPADAKACRDYKITKLQNELQELQQVK